MADENDSTPANENKPTPRRRAPRKTAPKTDAKPAASKRASRPATTPAKKPASKTPAKPSTSESRPKPETRTDRARKQIDKASEAVGGKRNLITGGLVAAAAGAAAAALLTLRGSSAKPKPAKGGKAHQADGTDSSAQMDALIADENMVPEKTPQA